MFHKFLFKVAIIGSLLLPFLNNFLHLTRNVSINFQNTNYVFAENYHKSASTKEENTEKKSDMNLKTISLPCSKDNTCYVSFEIAGKETLSDSDIEKTLYFQNLLIQTLEKIPYNLWKSLNKITFTFDEEANRGSASSKQVKLRIVNVDNKEFVAVLVHEIGHITDLGSLTGEQESGVSAFPDGKQATYKNDKSVEFYSAYWENSKKILPNSDIDANFISGYSKSDIFEHFGETFLTYILHPSLLKHRNEKQYDYFKNTVFKGFEYKDYSNVQNFDEYFYDATLLPYDLESFLE